MGKCSSSQPETGAAIYIKTGRFGPYVQLGKKSDETPSPKRASIAPGMIDGITLESALHALILPRTLGNDPITGEEIIANTGRFGPYVGMGRNFRSLKKASPYEVTLEEAITLLTQPKSLPKGATLFRTIGLHPKTKKELQVFQTKSGFYMPKGLRRIYIQNEEEAHNLTVEDAVLLLK